MLEFTKKACQNSKLGRSDLCLCCLSMPFWQASGVRNFRTFTVSGKKHNKYSYTEGKSLAIYLGDSQFRRNNNIKNICWQTFTSTMKLEDLKVLRRSPDLLNNVKIGQGQLQLIMEQILFYHIWGLQTFWSSDLNNLMNNPSNSPVISEKQIVR